MRKQEIRTDSHLHRNQRYLGNNPTRRSITLSLFFSRLISAISRNIRRSLIYITHSCWLFIRVFFFSQCHPLFFSSSNRNRSQSIDRWHVCISQCMCMIVLWLVDSSLRLTFALVRCAFDISLSLSHSSFLLLFDSIRNCSSCHCWYWRGLINETFVVLNSCHFCYYPYGEQLNIVVSSSYSIKYRK
mgnify:CR=1 FL=1